MMLICGFTSHRFAFLFVIADGSWSLTLNIFFWILGINSIGYPVVTLGFGVKSYVGYRIRHRKQREVAKENEFYMQLLQFALPNDELLHAQMKQAPEILHSDKLGDIDLPVSSAIIAQRIQQQQLLMMSSSHAPPSPSSTGIGTIYFIPFHFALGYFGFER